jgi:hypothetical protein
MSYEKQIAKDWIKSHSSPDLVGSDSDPLLIIEALIISSPGLSWEVISNIFECDENGETLLEFVAGPFESWIAKHSLLWIDFIEAEAKTNERFKWALGGLMQNNIPASAWKRIELCRGNPWPENEATEAPTL